jgi:hypothetical protein
MSRVDSFEHHMGLRVKDEIFKIYLKNIVNTGHTITRDLNSSKKVNSMNNHANAPIIMNPLNIYPLALHST